MVLKLNEFVGITIVYTFVKMLLMRSLLLFTSLIITSLAQSAEASVSFTVEWIFMNVEEGYDHQNRIEVFIDGKNVGTSEAFNETELGSFTVDVSAGTHKISIVNHALYEGRWEEHTIANNYSIDATAELSHKFSGSEKLKLVWDLDDADDPLTSSWSKGSSSAASSGSTLTAKEVPLTISWKYINVVEGYDHQTRVKVYVDGKLIETSKTSVESKGGTLTTKIPSGTHKLLVMTEAYYEGGWEEHTMENDYSVDGFVEKEANFKKATKLTVVFDIDAEDSEVSWK